MSRPLVTFTAVAMITAFVLVGCSGFSEQGSDATSANAGLANARDVANSADAGSAHDAANAGESANAAGDAGGTTGSGYSGRSYAGNVDRGELVFETNCATCHGAGGRAGGVGPSLISEYERQNLARTIEWIEAPDPPMPHLYPSPLTERDVADVAAFVQEIR